MTYNHEPLIEVSLRSLALAAFPLFILAYCSWIFDIGIQNAILVGTFRTFIQLSILSLILDPIFMKGEDLWGLVLCYALLMITLSALEATSRSKFYFQYMFWYVLVLLLVDVTISSLFAFGIIMQLEPVWDPQYVIPIVGMLLGNCINGISLALNSMLTTVVDSSSEIELMLSFGANPYESSSRLLKEAIRTGSMPQLNSMAIIGLISIPGMMTGQILGGSSVTQAARYQILIMYLIAFCSFGAILSLALFIVKVCFDSNTMLRTDRLYERQGQKSLLASWRSCSSFFQKFGRVGKQNDQVYHSTDETAFLAPTGKLSVTSSSPAATNGNDNKSTILDVSNLSFAFQKGAASGQTNDVASCIYDQVLFQNVFFRIGCSERVLVDGPSGAGKSTLLRIMAGLMPFNGGEIRLFGKPISGFEDMTVWRKQVMYVPQTKIEFPGSPKSLLQRIASFQVWKGEKVDSPSLSQMEVDVEELIQDWGLSSRLLDSDWKTLSGGESQRLLLAISLASRPKVILLDESTSSLDLKTKLEVENSIETYCKKHGMCAIWITHDQSQQNRMQLNGRSHNGHHYSAA